MDTNARRRKGRDVFPSDVRALVQAVLVSRGQMFGFRPGCQQLLLTKWLLHVNLSGDPTAEKPSFILPVLGIELWLRPG